MAQRAFDTDRGRLRITRPGDSPRARIWCDAGRRGLADADIGKPSRRLPRMTSSAPPSRTVTGLRLCVALIAVLSAALIMAAALVPAPPAVMPLVVLVGMG